MKATKWSADALMENIEKQNVRLGFTYCIIMTGTQVSLFRTECEHANHTSTEPARGLSSEIKLFINEEFDEGITKPNALLAILRKKRRAEPNKLKLIAYLRRLRYVISFLLFISFFYCSLIFFLCKLSLYRHQKYGQPTVSATVIKEWCESRKNHS